MRSRAAVEFSLNHEQLDERHHLTFDTYEEGKRESYEYLSRTVFYEPRSFTKDEFINFMFAQSKPYPEMMELIRKIKSKYGLRVTMVNNEGRELNIYRINKFNLHSLIDVFVSSSFVHFRKPDEDIYRIALDLSQSLPSEVLYIDDREMFVEVARGLGD